MRIHSGVRAGELRSYELHRFAFELVELPDVGRGCQGTILPAVALLHLRVQGVGMSLGTERSVP